MSHDFARALVVLLHDGNKQPAVVKAMETRGWKITPSPVDKKVLFVDVLDTEDASACTDAAKEIDGVRSAITGEQSMRDYRW